MSNLTSITIPNSVTYLGNGAFYNCNSMDTIDLRNFDTSSLTSTYFVFYKCSNLSEIKISSLWDISNIAYSKSIDMFVNCYQLPNYNGNYVDGSMAKPTTQGGYLTLV